MRVTTTCSSLVGGVILCALVLFLSGCKSKPPQYPEDHARFERIVAAIDHLRNAYQDKDADALRELMLPLEGLGRLQRTIKIDFETYDKIHLDFTIERMTINGGRATVNVRWEGEWQRQGQFVGKTEQGHGVLIWSGKQVILLADIDGDLPFGMAARESLS